jgi:hypothetical protein
MTGLRRRTTGRLLRGVLVAALLSLVATPGAAQAHGPVAPVASSYLARIGEVPAGVDAKAVDGDQRMWLEVAPGETVVVLDYRGAPYLRFLPSGVELNRNSSMYYLNQTPVALTPPVNLTASTPPRWQRVSGGHTYNWHDGRLHALATVARAPGATFVGTWRVPLIVDGRATAITGGLWYRPDPSIVWFWPIPVLLLCVLAAWRLREASLDARIARLLAVAALLATAVAAVGQQLYGRPGVTVFHYVELALILAFVLWGLSRVALKPRGFFKYLVFALAALWQGAILIPVLLSGFVLSALPAFATRAATVVCLGAGVSLLLLVFRLPEQSEGAASTDELHEEREDAWELA